MYAFHDRHSLDPNSIETVNQNIAVNQQHAVSTKAYRCGICNVKVAAYQFHYHNCKNKTSESSNDNMMMKDVGCPFPYTGARTTKCPICSEFFESYKAMAKHRFLRHSH